MFIIMEENPYHPDALQLFEELSQSLESITGNSGKGSFDLNDVSVPRALFVIARNQNGEAVGCGAIRPIDQNIAEVKRMYARTKGEGIVPGYCPTLKIRHRSLDTLHYGWKQEW